jgi:hypothetical protein
VTSRTRTTVGVVALVALVAGVVAAVEVAGHRGARPTTRCAGVSVPAGGDIQTAIDAHAAGTTFCLTGAFDVSSPLLPKSGDTFVGPADISGSAENGFDLKAAGARGVTVEGLTLHGFSVSGVNCWTGATIRNSEFSDNGRDGLGCGLEGTGDVLIEGNDIHDNGSLAELGYAASGMKFAAADGVVVRDNRIEHNVGNGVWCDVDCHAFTVQGNTVWGNTQKGIFFEISLGPAVIEDNTVTFNNCAPSVWGSVCVPQGPGSPGGGITANSSVNVIIRNNILGNNEVAGINVRDDSRPYAAPFHIVVTGNVLNGDDLLRCGSLGVRCSDNAS